jgi:hypothetical protein
MACVVHYRIRKAHRRFRVLLYAALLCSTRYSEPSVTLYIPITDSDSPSAVVVALFPNLHKQEVRCKPLKDWCLDDVKPTGSSLISASVTVIHIAPRVLLSIDLRQFLKMQC